MSAILDAEANRLRERVLAAVRDATRTRGVTDADLARATGISDATISRTLAGTQPLSLDNAVRLARWMGYELALVPRGGRSS